MFQSLPHADDVKQNSMKSSSNKQSVLCIVLLRVPHRPTGKIALSPLPAFHVPSQSPYQQHFAWSSVCYRWHSTQISGNLSQSKFVRPFVCVLISSKCRCCVRGFESFTMLCSVYGLNEMTNTNNLLTSIDTAPFTDFGECSRDLKCKPSFKSVRFYFMMKTKNYTSN